MNTLFLCGAGNPSGIRLAINVNNAEKKWRNIVILDDDTRRHGDTILNCSIAGNLDALKHADSTRDAAVNLIAGSTTSRLTVKNKIAQYGLPFARLIHPAVDTLGVNLNADDITVYENATLGAGSSIGDGCIVFMNAVLGHGAQMANGSILGPGAVLNARVILGEAAYFGTNASALPDLRIGPYATVAANASVVADVPAQTTVMGVPAENILLTEASESHAESPHKLHIDQLRKSLGELWCSVLHNEDIRSDDNFFAVGGSSRKAFELADTIGKATGLPISVLDIFHYPSIDALAQHCVGHCFTAKAGQGHFEHARQRAQARALARSHARAWARDR